MIRAIIWNEFVHERETGALGDIVRKSYPEGIHQHLRQALDSPDLDIRTATLDEPGHGLPEDVLDACDVLLWWGHAAHEKVDDALVERIRLRIRFDGPVKRLIDTVIHQGFEHHYALVHADVIDALSLFARWKGIERAT